MEVSGARGRVIKEDNSDHDDNTCDQCEESGLFVVASGFCQTCNDFLCSVCIKHHKKFRGTKHHALLEDDDIPQQKPAPIDAERCPIHPDRAVEMYCLDEDILGCTLCFSIGHRTCQNVDMISNLSKDVEFLEELTEIQEASEKQKSFSNHFRELVNELRCRNDNCHDKCLERYQELKSEMMNLLEKLGNNVSKRADKMRKQNNEKLEILMDLILSYEQHVVSCMENIPESIGLEELNRDQLFIAIKKHKKEIIESVQQFARLAPEFNIRNFYFNYNPAVKKMILKESKFNADAPTPSESTSSGSVENTGNVGAVSPLPTISKESKKMAGNVGLESPIPTISKESKKMAGNVGTESPIPTISKESKKMADNVGAESTTPTISEESNKKAGNVGAESPIPTISEESNKKAGNVGAVSPISTISKESKMMAGNVGTESPIPTISKESKKKAGNVGAVTTIPTIYKESKKKAGNVGAVSTIPTISKESKKKAGNVGAVSTIPTISKKSKKKAGNVGAVSTIPTISKESKKKADNVGAVTTTSPTCQCKDKVEKDNNFRKELPTIICMVTSFVNVKSSDDNNDCCISGIVVVSQTQLVLADFDNKCLKLVHMEKKEMIKRPLTSSPRDVTLIPRSQVAVSLPDLEEIQIFTADQNLEFCKSLYVAGRCHGLDCSGDKIVVSFTKPIMIQILDLMGNVLKTIQQDSSDKMLLCVPSYLTIRPDHKRIYISDQNKNTITCIDSEEIVHWVYKDKEMVSPNGVAIGESGHLYIGSKNNHTIHVVSPEGVRIAIIPVSQCGVHYPRAVCYSNYGQMMYISSNKQSSQSNLISLLSLRQ